MATLWNRHYACYSSPLHRWRNRGSKSWGDLPNVTQPPVTGKPQPLCHGIACSWLRPKSIFFLRSISFAFLHICLPFYSPRNSPYQASWWWVTRTMFPEPWDAYYQGHTIQFYQGAQKHTLNIIPFELPFSPDFVNKSYCGAGIAFREWATDPEPLTGSSI